MTTWILVLVIFSGEGTAITNIPEFTTKQECINKGIEL